MKAAKVTIGVRLSKDDARLLRDEARKHSMSLSCCVRMLVEKELRDEKRTLLLEEVREVRQGLLRLENHLKTATVALLTEAGKSSLGDAEEFVRHSLS